MASHARKTVRPKTQSEFSLLRKFLLIYKHVSEFYIDLFIGWTNAGTISDYVLVLIS